MQGVEENAVFYNAFSVTRLYSVDNALASE
jgi:hypothetical protein